jgi:hypothetical protein
MIQKAGFPVMSFDLPDGLQIATAGEIAFPVSFIDESALIENSPPSVSSYLQRMRILTEIIEEKADISGRAG